MGNEPIRNITSSHDLPLKDRKVVISTYSAWSILNYRKLLVTRLIALGARVIVISPVDEFVPQVQALGADFIPLPLKTTGRNPFNDLTGFFTYLRAFRRRKPDIVLNYTIKPVIYGTLAAGICGVKVINTITGIGQTFDQKPHVLLIIKSLYKISQRYANLVLFQNPDQQTFFINSKLLKAHQTRMVPGSGVDTTKFAFTELPHSPPLKFLLLGRMLKPKGVYEFVEAGRLLRERGVVVQLILAGEHHLDRDIAVDKADLDRWVRQGDVTYLGMIDDVPSLLKSVDCVVLPSYTEGTPRSLLEALACGRPIIASDVEGCREVLIDGVNGFYCRPKDPVSLADQIQKMAGLSFESRQKMAQVGRALIEEKFDECKVVDIYIQAINALISGQPVT